MKRTGCWCPVCRSCRRPRVKSVKVKALQGFNRTDSVYLCTQTNVFSHKHTLATFTEMFLVKYWSWCKFDHRRLFSSVSVLLHEGHTHIDINNPTHNPPEICPAQHTNTTYPSSENPSEAPNKNLQAVEKQTHTHTQTVNKHTNTASNMTSLCFQFLISHTVV